MNTDSVAFITATCILASVFMLQYPDDTWQDLLLALWLENANAWSHFPSNICFFCYLLSCKLVLTHVLPVGVTQEVTTVVQEANAALLVATPMPGATQGAGASSFPQENSGEGTQMVTTPRATQTVVAAGTSSAADIPDVEGRVLLHRLWFVSAQDEVVHLEPVLLDTEVSTHHTCILSDFFLAFCRLPLALPFSPYAARSIRLKYASICFVPYKGGVGI